MVNPYAPPTANLGAADPDGKLSDGRYEFTPAENTVIARAAKLARAWGIIAVAGGALVGLMVVAGVVAILIYSPRFPVATTAVILSLVLVAVIGPIAVVNVITGRYYIASGRSLQDVVETSGNDVAHLMTALDKVAGAFRLEVIFIAVTFALGILLQIALIMLSFLTSAAGGTP
jgi:hypothetical protein